ncbi:MAG: choice-of-anchor Q domain-containing protein [Candidatus Cloacimonadaceae bacterium]|nr:choice-of-anchor Q domain-containing protein [Candidatus Cloacimonadaceae bacterium]
MKQLLLIIMLLLCSLLFGQTMQGIYHIGGDGADFADLDDAISAIEASSVLNNLYFYLNPGTYTGPYVLEDLDLGGHTLLISSGSYSSDQVVFINHAATSQDNYIFKISNSSGIIIDGFDFAPTSRYSRSIYVYGDSNDIQIQNCRFFNYGTNSYDNDSIAFASNSNDDADNIKITFNQFMGGGYHISIANWNYNNNFSNWTLDSNLHNGGYCAIKLIMSSNLIIQNNTMHNVNQGIATSYLSGSLLVQRNRINAYSKGIEFSGSTISSSGSVPNIYNNIIRVSGYNVYSGNNDAAAAGLVIDQSSYIYAAHNSIELSSTNSSSIAVHLHGNYNKLRKNHFVNLGSGYVIYFNNVESDNSNHNIVEFNNIYGKGTNLGKQLNTYYKEISEMNALFGYSNADYNPFFTDEHLRCTSPSLDNLGFYVEIDEDFFGNPRSNTAPDIGAHEYSSDPSLTPLAGNYDIGSGGDFASINDFALALAQRGVSAAVTGLLNDASYSEQIVFDRIPGIGHDRIVTLKGNLTPYPTISYSGQNASNNYVLATYRSKYLRFEQISFDTQAQSYSNILVMNGFAQSISFLWCNFNAPSGLTGNNCNSISSTDYQGTSDLSLVACLFDGNSNGANLNGEDLVISNCTFRNMNIGISLNQVDDPRIDGNLLENISNTAISINGIRNGDIFYNRILSMYRGLTISTNNPAEEHSLIANNFISVSGQSPYTGLFLSGNGLLVLNNSIYINGGSNASALYFANQMDSEIEIVNNILHSVNGYCMDFGSYSIIPGNVIDYNDFYSSANYMIKIASDSYVSLAACQEAHPEINVHSVSYDPLWDENMNVQSQYLRGIAQIRSEFDDDINRNLRGLSWDIGAEQQFGPNSLDPLSGVYSVGSPESDYLTVADCLAALAYHGIDGNTYFELVPGTYDGAYVIKDFPRTEDYLSVTFRASGNRNIVLNPSSDSADNNYLFLVEAAHNVRFEDFNLSSNSNSHYLKYFRVLGFCHNISFDNLQITLPQAYSYAIHTGSSLGDGLSIQNCSFTGSGTAIAVEGSYYDNNRYNNITINSNTFNGVTYPISLKRSEAVHIGYNTFNNFNQAIYLENIGADSEIHRNRMITNTTGSSNACVTLNHVNGTADNPINILLNIIYLNIPSSSGNGLSITSSAYLQILHNTIVTSSNNDYINGLALSLNSVTNSSLRSNVFSAPKTGYALNVTSSPELIWEGNAYYCNNSDLGRFNGLLYDPQDYLESQIMDFTGVYANSLISESGYNSCSYLRNRGADTPLATDIDGNPWGDQVCPGANVIPDTGWLFTNDLYIGPGADFETLGAAFTALMNRGISQSITLHLAPGVYPQNIELSHIPSAFGDDFVKVLGPEEGAAIITYTAASPADNYVFRLTNTKNLIFDRLTFTTTNPQYGNVFHLYQYNYGLKIQNCKFYGAGGSSSSACAIYSSNCGTLGLIFENNLVQSMGYAMQIYDNSGFGDYILQNNQISDVYLGFSMQSIPYLDIIGNSISSTSNAISLINVNDFSVSANQLNSGSNSTTMYVHASNLSTGTQDIINNYIHSEGMNCLTMQRSANARLYHNTLVNTNSAANSAAFYQNNQCPGFNALNNIFVAASGTAACYAALANIDNLCNNIYYSANGNVVMLGSQILNDPAAYQAALGDASSLITNPLLETQSYVLQSNSPAIDAGANIIDVAFDIEGTPRDLSDIGCYEYVLLELDIPQNLRLVQTVNSTILTWNEVPGAEYYQVYSASSPDAVTWDMQTVQSNSLQINPDATARFFRVTAAR